MVARPTYEFKEDMAINGLQQQLCKKCKVGFVDLWDRFATNDNIYTRVGLSLIMWRRSCRFLLMVWNGQLTVV